MLNKSVLNLLTDMFTGTRKKMSSTLQCSAFGGTVPLDLLLPLSTCPGRWDFPSIPASREPIPSFPNLWVQVVISSPHLTSGFQSGFVVMSWAQQTKGLKINLPICIIISSFIVSLRGRNVGKNLFGLALKNGQDSGEP